MEIEELAKEVTEYMRRPLVSEEKEIEHSELTSVVRRLHHSDWSRRPSVQKLLNCVK